MIAIPFVFFSILFFKYQKKAGLLSVPALLLGVYMLTSFFAILIDKMDLYTNICPYVDINIGTAILYCVLLYVTIVPFLKVNIHKVENIIPLKTTKWIDLLVYFYFFSFIIIILLTYNDLIRNILLLGVNEELKADFRFGIRKAISLSGFPLMVYNRLRFFSSSSLMLLFVLFYSLAFLKKKNWYNIIIFIGSLGCVYDAIIYIDRSIIIYWMMFFLLCICVFYRFLDKKKKRIINILGLIVTGLIVCYVIYVNIARFSNLDISAGDQIISYAGQSYINFSLFVQELDLPKYTTVHIFPYITHLIDPEFKAEDWHIYVQDKTGIFIMCFSTFIGEFISNVGVFNTVLWCICFYIISTYLLRRKREDEISASQLFLVCILLCMPYLGIMASYYHMYSRELGALIFYFVFRISSNKYRNEYNKNIVR